ncbi:MAG: uncharacterized protein A8A55_2411 [Amphiamblys sp. WSBS2006]|nr:MAG: uncharacterized protein A8A55_2411 [Amphiamblys sp. WSBS2006]
MKRKKITLDKKHLLVTRRNTKYFIPTETTEYRIKENNGNTILLQKQPENDRTICIICREEPVLNGMFHYLCTEKHFLLCETCFDSEYIDAHLVKCPFCPFKNKEEELLSLVKEKNNIRNTGKTRAVVASPSAPGLCVLDRKTDIAIHDVKISDAVLMMLSRCARVTIGENVSVFSQSLNRENTIESTLFNEQTCYDELLDLYTGPYKIDSSRVEGIENIYVYDLSVRAEHAEQRRNILKTKNKSIRIRNLKILSLIDAGATILPKLNISEDNIMKTFFISSNKKKDISEIIKMDDGSVVLGKLEEISLVDYGVSIFLKIIIPEDNTMESLCFSSYKRAPVKELLTKEDRSIRTGEFKNLSLKGHAVCLFPKLDIPEDSLIEHFHLSPYKRKHPRKMRKTKTRSIRIRAVKTLSLEGCAINTLLELNIPEENTLDELELASYGKQDMAELLKVENNSIRIGGIKKMKLAGYAVDIITKINIPEDNVLEELQLASYKRKHLKKTLRTKTRSIRTGRLLHLSLKGYAACILPKLDTPKDNIIELLFIQSEYMKYVDRKKSIRLGRVKRAEIALEFKKTELFPRLSPLPEEMCFSVCENDYLYRYEDDLANIRLLFLISDKYPRIRELVERLEEIKRKGLGMENKKEREERKKLENDLEEEVGSELDTDLYFEKTIQWELERMGDTGTTRVVLDITRLEDTGIYIVEQSILIWSNNQPMCIPLEIQP